MCFVLALVVLFELAVMLLVKLMFGDYTMIQMSRRELSTIICDIRQRTLHSTDIWLVSSL